jgi:hypothetical protein
VRQTVALNARTSPGTLRILAGEGNASTRAAVARNRTTPRDLLADLSTDTAQHTRIYVAQNPATHTYVLVARLLHEADPVVRTYLQRALAQRAG